MARLLAKCLPLILLFSCFGCGLRPTPPEAPSKSRPSPSASPQVGVVSDKPSLEKPQNSREEAAPKPFIIAHDEPSDALAQPVASRVAPPSIGLPAPSSSNSIKPASASIAKLARNITAGKESDRDKAHAIYRWLGDNIAYDTQSLFSGELSYKSPDTVVLRRKAVCAGYAELFHVMCREVGVESEVIPGRSRSEDQNLPASLQNSPTNHAWNAVKIDGEWKLVDPTWGAGYINEQKSFVKEPSDEWFLVAPEVFLYSHLPQAPEWQLLEETIGPEEFDSQPEIKPRFFAAGLELIEPKKQPLKCRGEITFRVASKNGYVVSAIVKSGSRDLPATRVLAHQRRGQSIVKIRFPEPGDYKVLLMARKPEESMSRDVASFKVHSSLGHSDSFPKTYKTFGDTNAQIIRGFAGELSAGKRAAFIYEVPGASKLLLKNGDDVVPMEQKGTTFSIEFTPEAGEVKIMAGFAGGGDRYPVLTEYTVR